MADNNKPTMPTANQAIPTPKYNWRGDAAVTRRDSQGSVSPTFSFLSQSQSPTSAGMANAGAAKRRDSLKNMVHLCDFATP